MKGLLIVLISAAMLFSCKDKEKPWCEQDNSGELTIHNSATGDYRVKTYREASDGSYPTTYDNVIIKGGETWSRSDETAGKYKIEAIIGTTVMSVKYTTVSQCKTTEVTIP